VIKLGRQNHGKTIKLKMEFFTKKIDKTEIGLNVVETRGIIKALENKQRGIKPTKPEFFNKWSELQSAILKTFKRVGVKVSKRWEHEP